MVLPLDLTDFEAVASKVEKAISFHGCIDILINNGGISSRGSVIDTLLDVHMKVMNVNYFGQVALTKGMFGYLCMQLYWGHNMTVRMDNERCAWFDKWFHDKLCSKI